MPNNPSNLYRRGKIWWGRLQRGGADDRRSLRTTDREEAKKRFSAWEEEVAHAAFYGEARHSFKEASVKWAEEVLPRDVKPATQTRYLVSLAQLAPYFGDKHIDEITGKMIARYISDRKKLGVTNATIRRDLTALSRILACCVAWSWREDNPARTFDRSIIKERRDPITPPTDAQVEMVIAKAAEFTTPRAPSTAHLLIRFLAQTGMRLDEAASLEWSQVDLKRKAVTLTKTKTNRPRVVPLDDLITSAAAGTLSGTPRHITSPYVFWHGDGERYTQFSSRFAQLTKACGLEFRCHDLRHKFAVDYLVAGGDVYRLSKILGHTSVKTTEIYLGFADIPQAQNQAQLRRSAAGCADERPTSEDEK